MHDGGNTGHRDANCGRDAGKNGSPRILVISPDQHGHINTDRGKSTREAKKFSSI